MRENQSEILKENLERRFSLLVKNTNYNGLFNAKMEYLNYLFSEKISGEVIENLIKKIKLNNSQIDMLALGYFDYVIGKATRQTKLETLGKDDYKKMASNCKPPFYTSFIDSELHLQEKAFYKINKVFGLNTKLAKELVEHSKLEPDEILKKLKGNSKINKFVKDIVAYHKNKPVKLIDNYDIEINDFSLFHSSLIEEINDLLIEEIKVIKNKNIVEIKNKTQVFIDGKFSKVELTPKLVNLLEKLLIVDDNGNYSLVRTRDLKNKKKKNNDDFRTALTRLRTKTEKLFVIKNTKNKDEESCYTIIFKD